MLYQDEDLLLVRKPHLLLSIPGRHPANKDCLIHRLQTKWPTASIVHRLDLDTSGVMVIPLKKSIHSDISRQFQDREVKKQYIAVVYGDIEQDQGTIELPIRTDWENRPLQKICFEKGKSALTHYKVISRGDNQTRILLNPITGRSHQLRIHMRELGHPILGCDMYAHDEALNMSPRLLLHATRLSFRHPGLGVEIVGESEPDF